MYELEKVLRVSRIDTSVNKAKSLAKSNGLFAFVSVEYLLHGLYIIFEWQKKEKREKKFTFDILPMSPSVPVS